MFYRIDFETPAAIILAVLAALMLTYGCGTTREREYYKDGNLKREYKRDGFNFFSGNVQEVHLKGQVNAQGAGVQ